MYILFDIGGSKMRVASSSDGRKFNRPQIAKTPKNFREGMRVFKELVELASSGKKIKATAGGIPGYFDKDKTKILGCAPNIKHWVKKPLKSEIQKITKSRVFLENDSDLVGLGEAIYGAGKGYPIVAYLTVSTGVGGGRIINGKIDSGRLGTEPGNQYIDFKNKKDLEDLIAGRSVTKKYHKKPYQILDARFWDKMAEILAYGVNNTIVHWSPDVVVIGGSMMKKIGIKIPRVEIHLKKIMRAFPDNLPKIKKATLGDFGGLYGALARIKQR
ncbi:MAG: ROK family protein [Candidatus Liptonbacteria bacterium]|nr:ROK family protein [Candidatus Liptonbacteria bacterium]